MPKPLTLFKQSSQFSEENQDNIDDENIGKRKTIHSISELSNNNARITRAYDKVYKQ